MPGLAKTESDRWLLIDGCVLNPVPIAPTYSDMTELTIDVSLGGKAIITNKIATDSNSKIENTGQFARKVTAFVESFNGSAVNNNSKDWGNYVKP